MATVQRKGKTKTSPQSAVQDASAADEVGGPNCFAQEGNFVLREYERIFLK
jgi:hypothetical protein